MTGTKLQNKHLQPYVLGGKTKSFLTPTHAEKQNHLSPLSPFTMYYVPITAKMVAVPCANFHIKLTQLLEFDNPFVGKGKAKNHLTRPSAKGAQKLLQFSRNQLRIITGC